MCGIAGTLGARQPASREFLLEMAGELLHRGPDGVGLYIDHNFGMVNTRLSIVDLAGGDQPLSNETGRYWVMQNGEIYNYVELQDELESLGHQFATSSDTEVIAHAFEEWGAQCLAKLNGDFAFAVWDRETRELFLARDRFGVRPLFLANFGDSLSFASEAKALLRHPRAKRELDALGLVETFTMWSILPDRSAFQDIYELPAGHYLRYSSKGLIEQRRWWDVPFVSPDEARKENATELAEELRSLLEDATRLRLRADVPVGAYLSGGLDSSAIAGLTRQLTTQKRQSFSVSFADPRFDESSFQGQMANALGTELSGVSIKGSEIAEDFPEVVHLAEKPLLRTAPAPLHRLSKLVRQTGFKVVLTGEGADELFGGYDIFKEAQVRRFWAKQPDSKLRPLLFKRLYPYLTRDTSKAGAFLSHFFSQGLTETDDPLYSHQIRFNNTSRSLRFLDGGVLEEATLQGDSKQRLLNYLPENFAGFSNLSKAQYLEIHTFLSGYLLSSQGDRMLMGNSVEGRFPFLDYRVAEFAAKLPDRLRLQGLQEKFLLRKAVAPLLPKNISSREKRPYRSPILQAFIGSEAPSYVQELLEPTHLAKVGLFKPEAVKQLVEKCKRLASSSVGETDEMALVGIISTLLLHKKFVARPMLAPAAKATKVVVGSDIQTPVLQS
jgi:asparagine synthase (glutamine-hydrolysing)